jgi:hypothetical protein
MLLFGRREPDCGLPPQKTSPHDAGPAFLLMNHVLPGRSFDAAIGRLVAGAQQRDVCQGGPVSAIRLPLPIA